MKKGFTLIELIIVMVVVAVLVTIAVPKYKMAMERGRGLEGLANAQAWSDAANACYVKNYNSYGSDIFSCSESLANYTKNGNFGGPSISYSSDTGKVTVSFTRSTSASSWLYKISFLNEGGETTTRTCTASSASNLRYCKALGAGKNCTSTSCDF